MLDCCSWGDVALLRKSKDTEPNNSSKAIADMMTLNLMVGHCLRPALLLNAGLSLLIMEYWIGWTSCQKAIELMVLLGGTGLFLHLSVQASC